MLATISPRKMQNDLVFQSHSPYLPNKELPNGLERNKGSFGQSSDVTLRDIDQLSNDQLSNDLHEWMTTKKTKANQSLEAKLFVMLELYEWNSMTVIWHQK